MYTTTVLPSLQALVLVIVTVAQRMHVEISDVLGT